ncbi:uncharacterized, partial [Tachysurus ichikawai]
RVRTTEFDSETFDKMWLCNKRLISSMLISERSEPAVSFLQHLMLMYRITYLLCLMTTFAELELLPFLQL